jgi:cell division protein FtsQ
MVPKSRQRARPAGFRWPFGRRGNRRIRLTSSPSLPPVAGIARSAAGGIKRHAASWLLCALLLALGGAGFLAQRFLTRSPHFAVKTVRFSPGGGVFAHLTDASLRARAGVSLGENLFAVDLDAVARDLAQDPWVRSAHARRELPSTVVVEVSERQAACVVALGALYLADASGAVFKRATPEEAAALPVVTGIARDDYLAEPASVRGQLRDALTLLSEWQKVPTRPALGEIHFDRLLGATAYAAKGELGVRLGAVDATLPARLDRFDVVAAALAREGAQPRFIYLDNRARPDRVTVKLASPAPTDVAHAMALANQKSET